MNKIPKIIHYCWVGDAPKPESVLYCIESWKKNCPDYEIREWNESNYDFTKNKYMKQAYDAKKWGFVPDYARLDIVYQYGGIYLDTDVEVIKSFDDLLVQNAFMGFENTGDGKYFVNCGHGFGAVPKHEIIKEARDLYEHVDFLKDDGSYNLIPSPYYTTQALRQFGLKQENKEQDLKKMKVYKSDVLCPKNFLTGKIKVTEKTVSIHHFTASWMDEKIRKELEHQQKIKKIFGKKIGAYVFLLESVIDKYSVTELITKLPMRLLSKLKKKIIKIIEITPYFYCLFKAKKSVNGNEAPILLDTSLNSDNVGDQIIMENCMKQLDNKLNVKEMIHVPTHTSINEKEKDKLLKSKFKILCGTNILSGNMRTYGLWKLTPDVEPYINTVLMGVGFDSSTSQSDLYTRKFFNTILSKDFVHSVRDSNAEKHLKEMGIKNVINTGCPTMWGLTPEHCKSIPVKKARNAICTITDYNQDKDNDKKMLEIILNCYENVYVWIQGKYDYDYLKELGMLEKLKIVDNTLEDFDEVLKQDNLDYVGTRLHAGIRSLSFKHRSIIISIDNRAESIGKDTGLPIVKREDVSVYLKSKILSEFKTEIKLPVEEIEKWLNQFNY